MSRYTILAVTLLVTTITLFAQSRSHRSYPTETLTVNDGLSQSSVYCITQDSLGFMWFGSGDGLTRFDGKNFHRYLHRNQDPASPASHAIRGLVPANEGFLWIGTDAGLQWFDPIRERFFMVPHPDLQRVSCAPITAVKDDVIVQVEGQGIGAYNYARNEWRWLWQAHGHPLGLWRFWAGKGRVLVRYGNEWIIQVDLNHGQVDTLYLPVTDQNLAVGGITVSDGGRIFVTMGNQCWAHHNGMWSRFPTPGIQSNILGIHVDTEEILWLGVEGTGISQVWPDGTTRFIWSHPQFTAGSVYGFFPDRFGNLWAGVDGVGAVCFGLTSSFFDHYTVPLLRSGFIKCMMEDADGRWWVGYHENGLEIIDPVTLTVTNPLGAEVLRHATIFDLISSQDGVVWINSSQGLYRYVDGGVTLSGPPGWAGIAAQDIWLTPNGNVQGIWGTALYTWRSGTWVNRPLPVSRQVRFGKALSNHYLGIGTDDGLYLWNPSSNVEPLHLLPDRKVRSICQTKDSLLWVATTTGLGLVSLNTLVLTHWWDESKDLPNNYVYGVLADDNGHLWISTNRGLCTIDPDGFEFRCFTVNHGLQSMEFNTNAFTKLRDGRLLFGGIGGFNVIHPPDIPEDLPAIPLILTDLQWQGRSVARGNEVRAVEHINLPYANSRLIFDLQAMVWPDGGEYQIFARLEGQDEAWLPLGQGDRVSYTNLAPGVYRLWARVGSSDGRMGEDQMLMEVHIGRPWWRTIWFYGGIIASIALMAGGFVALVLRSRYRKRVRKAELLAAKELLRVQLARDIHDDLGAGLSKIALMSELGAQQSEDTLPEIATAARDLIGRMGEIIWAMEPGASTWEDLLVYFRSYGAEYLEHSNVLFSVEVEGKIPAATLNPGQKRNLLLIYKEALRNVQQHSNATRVQVVFHFEGTGCRLAIRDNGNPKGDAPSMFRGRGLENMKQRAKLTGGWCEAGPVDPAGWIVQIFIPYSNL